MSSILLIRCEADELFTILQVGILMKSWSMRSGARNSAGTSEPHGQCEVSDVPGSVSVTAATCAPVSVSPCVYSSNETLAISVKE